MDKPLYGLRTRIRGLPDTHETIAGAGERPKLTERHTMSNQSTKKADGASVQRGVRWPVTVGSKWKSKSFPGSVWELTMAESSTQMVRLNSGNFAWEGTVTLAQQSQEFEAI